MLKRDVIFGQLLRTRTAASNDSDNIALYGGLRTVCECYLILLRDEYSFTENIPHHRSDADKSHRTEILVSRIARSCWEIGRDELATFTCTCKNLSVAETRKLLQKLFFLPFRMMIVIRSYSVQLIHQVSDHGR